MSLSSFLPIVNYIDAQFESYLTAERASEMRINISDKRVHALLYFIPPSGHGLKELDIEFMKKLSNKVNLIPVISKADSLTIEEQMDFKRQVN